MDGQYLTGTELQAANFFSNLVNSFVIPSKSESFGFYSLFKNNHCFLGLSLIAEGFMPYLWVMAK